MRRTPDKPRTPTRLSRLRGNRLPEAENTSTSLERADLLHEVLQHVIKSAKYERAPWPRPRYWIPATTLLALGFAAYSWAAKPEWIWGRRTTAQAAPALQEANMRFAMYLLAQRIIQYRINFGAVPADLSAVGGGIPGVRYETINDTAFALKFERGTPLFLYSTQSMDDFLKNAVDVVTAGKPR